MNITEAKALRWLEKHGYKGLRFSSSKNPDFVTDTGQALEIKLERKGTIVFSQRQFSDLAKLPNCLVLVFNGGDNPVATIPFFEIKDKPAFWRNIRIVVSNMSKLPPGIPQGSKLSISEVAKRLGVSYWTARRRVLKGEIKAVKLDNNVWQVEEAELNRYIDKEGKC